MKIDAGLAARLNGVFTQIHLITIETDTTKQSASFNELSTLLCVYHKRSLTMWKADSNTSFQDEMI